ncbi:DFP-domain-containing protein [Stereum hirsutum FP-91666 SS1]|uniref:DFP-domain-containing protein n=1 Tax=Stereum hirsutum (strain FP-91666) TaxID=721885 RepID=UPI000440DD59|nr:DFP-domain-containing protein [Stereum hirsutum FP-91666 SS1]EIM88836.1 DFP-domain-containing protein [Stereum hirsutum FP-91666 SS1]
MAEVSETASTSTFSAESYFATQPPPPSLEHDIAGVRAFVGRQREKGRRVVLVTSGGTTVPLELNVVRFLDNFSAGTRGATSAEYFLKAGYAVVFMHRQFSLQPFSRHYSHSTNPFLDFLEVNPHITSSSPNSSDITVTPSKRAELLETLKVYKEAHHADMIHTLTFVTVNDYLWLLRAVSQELSVLRRGALYYLAAAVSDFFLPRQKMSEHKIQSGKGSLLIEMDQVPKILKPMVDEWTRDGFIVSFKLETDPNLLIPKARGALERYGHQIVIGNDLNRRKFEVVFVARTSSTATNTAASISSSTTASEDEITHTWLRLDPNVVGGTKEIEEDIIAELVKRHDKWVEAKVAI